MVEALQDYEAKNPALCTLIPSEDQFYGATKGANRLAAHMQWVFVPAVKDIADESHESKTSSLGLLLARTVRAKVDFSEKVTMLRELLKREYQQMLEAEQSILGGLSESIEMKLRDWAHPGATAKVLWKHDAEKSVKVDEPWAFVQIGERGFESELARFGHGMQRSFMLTLLQEIASADEDYAPTLVLAIEEPELYQHPPQARYLAEVLHDLSGKNAQIIVCSHSPLFVPGDDFEAVRVVRDSGTPSRSSVKQLLYKDLSSILHSAGQKLLKEKGILAKLFPLLNPTINEMFFCRVLVLVEGIEDVAYIASSLSVLGLMTKVRQCGCHIVHAGGKSEIIKALAIAKGLDIPVFAVIDGDTDCQKPDQMVMHKADNRAVSSIMGYGNEAEWPAQHIRRTDLVVWKENLGAVVEAEVGARWKEFIDDAAAYYGQPGGLKKNPLAISRALASAWTAGDRSISLEQLAHDIVKFAEKACSN